MSAVITSSETWIVSMPLHEFLEHAGFTNPCPADMYTTSNGSTEITVKVQPTPPKGSYLCGGCKSFVPYAGSPAHDKVCDYPKSGRPVAKSELARHLLDLTKTNPDRVSGK